MNWFCNCSALYLWLNELQDPFVSGFLYKHSLAQSSSELWKHTQKISVYDPHYFDADLDPDPWIRLEWYGSGSLDPHRLIRIRIRIFESVSVDTDPDPWIHIGWYGSGSGSSSWLTISVSFISPVTFSYFIFPFLKSLLLYIIKLIKSYFLKN